jgi:hypothetical protein
VDNRSGLTKMLVIAGTVLVWIPILAPVLFSALVLVTRLVFRFDYLMPAELFPAALLGGLLLLWAAIRVRSRGRLIGGGLAIAIAALAGGQAVAVVTGVASGRTEPGGGWGALILASLAVYCLALLITAAGGVLLLRDVFQGRRLPPKGPSPG